MSNLSDPKAINNWFDIKNVEHLKAYRALQVDGRWPKEFWSLMCAEHVSFPTNWAPAIAFRMADEYLKTALAATCHRQDAACLEQKAKRGP